MSDVGEKVIWEDIRLLANRVDNIAYDKLYKNIPNGRVRLPRVKTSKEYGLPDLCGDPTTPFSIKFPCPPKDKNGIHLRFEFAYHNTVDGIYCYEYVNDPYQNKLHLESSLSHETKRFYADGTRWPILHSIYLVKDPQSNEELPPSELIDAELYLECTCDNVNKPSIGETITNLVENNRDKLYRWWPCKNYYGGGVSADLYFLTESKDSLCHSAVRVCLATAYGENGNGNGKEAYKGYGPTHYWEVGEALTLSNVDFTKYKPETNQKAYAVPPLCKGCALYDFPYIGNEAGVYALGDGQEKENTECSFYSAGIFREDYPGTNNSLHRPFAPAKKSECCDAGSLAAYEEHSVYEKWDVRYPGVEGYVRLTPLHFIYYKTKEDGEETNEILSEAHVWLPTAITVTLQGTFNTAIRKRWYDMILHKMKVLMGYWPSQSSDPEKQERPTCGPYSSIPKEEDTRPEGTTWSYEWEKQLSALDKPCARWNSLGLGWKTEEGDQLYGDNTEYSYYSWNGEKYWEQYLGVMLELIPSHYTLDDKGGLCLEKDEEEELNDCKDYESGFPFIEPWNGGCNNDKCLSSYNVTHWYTVEALNKLAEDIETYKIEEKQNSDLWIRVGDWECCSPDFGSSSISPQYYNFSWDWDAQGFQNAPYSVIIKGSYENASLYIPPYGYTPGVTPEQNLDGPAGELLQYQPPLHWGNTTDFYKYPFLVGVSGSEKLQYEVYKLIASGCRQQTGSGLSAQVFQDTFTATNQWNKDKLEFYVQLVPGDLGISVAIVWCPFLFTSREEHRFNITIKSPLENGAVEGNQYIMRGIPSKVVKGYRNPNRPSEIIGKTASSSIDWYDPDPQYGDWWSPGCIGDWSSYLVTGPQDAGIDHVFGTAHMNDINNLKSFGAEVYKYAWGCHTAACGGIGELDLSSPICPALMTTCNKGGQLTVKPWIASLGSTESELGDIVETFEVKALPGGGKVINRPEINDLNPLWYAKGYTEKSNSKSITWENLKMVSKKNDQYRGYIGFTIILESYQQAQTLKQISTLENYVFKPKNEYIKITIEKL